MTRFYTRSLTAIFILALFLPAVLVSQTPGNSLYSSEASDGDRTEFPRNPYHREFTDYEYDETINIERPEIYDSLLAEWYKQNVALTHETYFQDFINLDTIPMPYSEIPDSVYQYRMRAILSPIIMGYNDVIKRYIITYTTRQKSMMGRILGLSQCYFPMFEEELEKAGLPLELRMLPVIESALNPVAVSRAGATGIWQFMLMTGKSYGLQVTSFIDERRDPVLATRAACRYLGDLYNLYNDWTLAIAAYNCGPGNVNRALKRAGDNAKTFWDIYPYLPRETRGYIPSFIAATYTYTYHMNHGIEFVPPHIPVATDTVHVNRMMHLEQVSSTLDIPIDALRALNPQYKIDIIPAVDKSYALTLPQNDICRYIENEQAIHAKDTIYLASYLNLPPEKLTESVAVAASTRYRVQSGDTLGAIARKHGVTVAQLMNWNNIKNANTLRVGQVIDIFK